MKVYNTLEEVNEDIVDNVLTIQGDVTFTMPLLKIDASILVKAGNIKAWNINAGSIDAWNIDAGSIDAWNIKAWDINAGDINAGDINAGSINAGNIKAGDINAGDINAGDINAGSINAGNIKAGNIKAGNINAGDINAGDISFYAVCWSYFSLKCKSIVGRREKSKYFCLDKEVEIITEPEVIEMTVAEISKALGKTIKIVE